MKLMKFGKALLMSALSAGLMLGVTSCVRGYTVGYLYVTEVKTADSSENGLITGYKIDHNTGKLTVINGMPVSSGGANPERAVLLSGSRFVYVLNKGVKGSDGNYTGANITQFAVAGNGSLSSVQTFTTIRGTNPFRMIADGSGSHIYVLSQYAPTSSSGGEVPAATACPAILSSANCGAITAFSVDSNTGRLSIVTNAAGTASLGQTLTYFPVPQNPIDFTISSSYLLTISNTPATTNGTGETVYPYSYSSTSGQLTVNPADALSDVTAATAIQTAGSYVYVMDNEPGSTSAKSQILPYSVGTNGALTAVSSEAIADDSSMANPVRLTLDSKGKYLYVVNAGNNTTSNSTTEAGIASYVLNNPYQPSPIKNEVSLSGGSGPRCIIQDPSNQYFYEANYNDSTITAQWWNANTGALVSLTDHTKAPSSYTLDGPATWCIVNGRTN